MNVYKSPEIRCCVHGCDSKLSYKTFEKVKFHPFPRKGTLVEGKDLLLTWIKNIKLTRKCTDRMRVCSLHFTDEDFIVTDDKKELKGLAIPTKKLPNVWRNKFYPRDYGRMIKQLEYRGIGRLRLCHESKLVRRLKKSSENEFQISESTKKKTTDEKLDDSDVILNESKLTPAPMPKVSNAFSLSTNDKVIENDTLEGKDNFTSEIMIKEEPLSENEDMEFDETMNDDGMPIMQKGDDDKDKGETVEEMLAKMNADEESTDGSKNKNKKNFNNLNFDYEDTLDSTGTLERYCNLCGEEVSGDHACIEEVPEFECVPCGKVFKTHRQLNAHNLSHFEYRTKKLSPEEQRMKDQQMKETTCKVCHKVLSTKMTLNEHMLIHSGEKPHVCMLCEKAFRHKANLVQHVNTHTLVRNYKCKMCRQYFYTQEELDKHVRKHRVVKKEYWCRECGQSFRSKAACWAHLNTHVRGRNKAGLECNICGRVLSTKATLREHMFIHSGEKPFECLLCGKKIRHRANFIIHVQGHSLGQPHICSSCGMSFSKKSELNTHMSSEHPEDRPFGCIICGNRFRSESKFLKHAVSHDATLEEV